MQYAILLLIKACFMPEVLEQHIIPTTPEDELKGILAKQQIETKWWENAPKMETDADIEREVQEGRASRIADEGVGYKISPGVKEQFKVLENNTKALLEEVARRWIEKLHLKGIESEGAYLRITSLARTTKYQQELIEKGYPAAPDSTHTKLGAFDILINWFQNNRPELFKALQEVLDEIKKDSRANCIEEPEIGVMHIAFNRTTIM